MTKKLGCDVPRILDDLDDQQLSENLARYTLIADETRLRLLFVLSEGALNIADLCSRLGRERPVIAHHLMVLRVAGIIQADRLGTSVFYSLSEPGWGLIRVCRSLKEL